MKTYQLPFTGNEIIEKLNKIEGHFSYNDLTDKPFGENKDGTITQLDNKYLSILEHIGTSKEILEEQTITSLNNVQGDIKIAYLPVFDIVEGETYQIHWLDRVFTCEAISATLGDTEGLGLGNFSIMVGGEDTNEPFLIGVPLDKSFAAMYTTETTLPITFRIYQTERYIIKNEHLPSEAIKTIVDEYIGEVLRGEY